MRWVMHAKIHKATVTEANLDYVGSITIDEGLIEKAFLSITVPVEAIGPELGSGSIVIWGYQQGEARTGIDNLPESVQFQQETIRNAAPECPARTV